MITTHFKQAAALSILIALAIGIRAGFGAAPVVAPAPPNIPAMDFPRDIQPLLATYCTTCHNPDKQKGDLDLAQFTSLPQVMAATDIWPAVAERLIAGDMPPAKSKQPTDAERKKLIAWVSSFAGTEIDCSDAAFEQSLRRHRGGVQSRRLNRNEYNNTIRDLIGLDLKPADAFPADGSGGEGFDNNGDALFVSPMLLEKYLAAAETIIGTALGPAPYSPEVTAARRMLLVARPGPQFNAREAARRIVADFARRAFRRTVTEAEVNRLLTLFDRANQRGDSYEESLKLPLEAILISPNFLFLVETEPEKQGVYRVNDFVLAARLSYFLWSSMPDEKLLTLAEADKLHDPVMLREQVRRMIKDPRSRALAESFALQWLGIEELGVAFRPDRNRFPDFDEAMAKAMKLEPVLFLDAMLRDDRSLLELLDSDYTFANANLASLYGIEGVKGGEMRRITLPDRTRGGVLGMAGVLTATSYPLRTSPVLRGRWVMEAILGGKIPPPPADAGTLPTDDKPKDGITFRERLEKHRTKAECIGCHQKMDPLGFGLENFDPIGRWRDKAAGEPVDAKGVLPSGDTFTGPVELKGILLKRKDEFLKNFCRKLTGYALGRSVGIAEQCAVQDAMTALPARDYKASAVIEAIVLSKPFQYRYAGK